MRFIEAVALFGISAGSEANHTLSKTHSEKSARVKQAGTCIIYALRRFVARRCDHSGRT